MPRRAAVILRAMRNPLRLGLTATFVLAGLVVLAPAAHPATAPSVDDVVAKNIAARGGVTRLKALASLRMTGKIRFGGGDFTTEAEYSDLRKRPAMERTEVTLQGLTQVSGYDSKDAWSFSPFGGRREAEKASADETKVAAESADFDGPLVDWRDKGHKVELLGTEDVDGTPAIELRVTRKSGNLDYVFLDPDSYLEIRVRSVTRVRGIESVSETDFGDYRQVGGVWVPFSMDSGSVGGPRVVHLTFDRIEANVAADDALFHFPVAGAVVSRAVVAGPPDAAPTPLPVAPDVPAGAAVVIDAGTVSGLGARNIGSAAMSGRIAAVAAANDGGKTTLYVGAASGGVWRSYDGGTTFTPVFDKQPVQSIGAITIDPSHPKTIWVGSGEAWTRNSVSIGNGIYKSTDAGDTWANVGLPESERIVKIVVDPRNGDTVYACVPGKLWSDSADRGVYKTTDGGKTWSLVLKGGNLSTGCSGLSMDPRNPGVLFAGMWDFRRQGWTFRSGGDGPDAASGSGLYRSADGGKTWTALTARTNKGLPEAPWGRVEVVVAPSNASVIYALIESRKSALYRSADGGKTWEQRDRSQMMVWRPFYFARLVVDPTNPDRLFKPDGGLIVSEDGGRTFSGSGGGSHGDWHDLWIDPANPKHVIGGDDGGLWLSYDGGNRWWKVNSLPVSQFYHVAVDDKDPYQVYGGLQDNSSWVGDSSYPGGITNSRWENLYGGDGFWTVPDPTDPDAVYAESQGGNLGRVDRKTLSTRAIQPKAGYHEKLRFNWNTPIQVSPTRKGTLYLGAQFLFRSTDRGESWERISPDLTTNDPEKQKQEQSGGVTVDNSSAEMHTTIYSISESPRNASVLWVGTDDGNLQLSRNAGKTWDNVVGHVPGLPKASWVSWVEASRHDAATAYAAFDRHTFGDMAPWVFKTTDYGKTWTRIVGPDQGVRGYVHVIKEDTVRKDLLFMGTELGLWISVDGGARWAEFKGSNFPAVAVRDLQVQAREHDLVVATHGRGLWIIDDLTALRALSTATLARNTAFLPGRPVQQRMSAGGGWVEGDATFVGESAPGGAVISYYLRTRHIYGPIKLEILDAKGNLIDTVTPTKRRGINRVTWTTRVKPPKVPRAAEVAGSSTQGPRVLPGTYTLRLTRGAEVVETKLVIGLDRRARYKPADRKAQFDAVMRAHALFGDMSQLVDRLDHIRAAAQARLEGLGADEPLAAKLRALVGKLDELKKKIVATTEGGAITGELRIREHLDDLYGTLESYEGRPTRYQLERIDVLARELGDVGKDLDALVASEVRPLDDQLKARKLEPIATAADADADADGDERRGPDEHALRCVTSRGRECESDVFEATRNERR
jgi:photosystem II stability/assembly factor-like uncharacterized protein